MIDLRIKISNGSKGPGDELITITAVKEAINIADLLWILQRLFRIDDKLYPRPEFQGRRMLMNAIQDVYYEHPMDKILRKYKLDNPRVKKAEIVDLSWV